MRSLLDRAKEISHRFRGLKATRCFFPEVYAGLKSTLILNDDALFEIDLKLVELLNEHCFPCYDPCYDYVGGDLVRGRTGSHLPELPFKTVHEFCSHTAPQ